MTSWRGMPWTMAVMRERRRPDCQRRKATRTTVMAAVILQSCLRFCLVVVFVFDGPPPPVVRSSAWSRRASARRSTRSLLFLQWARSPCPCRSSRSRRSSTERSLRPWRSTMALFLVARSGSSFCRWSSSSMETTAGASRSMPRLLASSFMAGVGRLKSSLGGGSFCLCCLAARARWVSSTCFRSSSASAVRPSSAYWTMSRLAASSRASRGVLSRRRASSSPARSSSPGR
mmetsp:Transcript_8174/g.26794  ORF Transcript_8174/g.26794 Transcript_8174/m.26794 type:complete len:231 (+) Transcript_8174:300-992(+)